MTGIALRAVWLTSVYLLVLTSMAPGDLLVGGALGLSLSVALRPRSADRGAPGRALAGRARAAVGILASTAVDVARGTWRTARFCLGSPAEPGLVEIPRGDRSDARVALWGVLTGEAPDEYPVDLDAERGVLLVHVLDASDPDAVRARHATADEHWQRTVMP